MINRLLLSAACLWLVFVSPLAAQITVTNISVADAFVSSLNPANNYGGAGALSVSGPIATNAVGQQAGLLDTFMRFDTSGAFSNFNSSFGPGQWMIVRATLNLFEQGAPNNTNFNRGVGPFQVQWIVTNSWAEGTGNPNDPTTDGVVWNDEPSMLTNLDESLGTFVNGGTDGLVRVSLGTPSGFMSDISTGGLASFYMTATTNSTVGFTFHSHDFVDSTQWPFLEIMAVPTPRITALTFMNSNVMVGFTTVNGLTSTVEYTSNLVSASWNVLTNITGAGGTTNVMDSGAAVLPKRFYRVQLTVPP